MLRYPEIRDSLLLFSKSVQLARTKPMKAGTNIDYVVLIKNLFLSTKSGHGLPTASGGFKARVSGLILEIKMWKAPPKI